MSIFLHEEYQRGSELLARMRDFPVTLCGVGALGANIAEGLARSGFGRLALIDHDRVEERNLSTQPYQRADVGVHKAKTLANNLYRAVGTQIEARIKTLDSGNVARLLRHSALVVDTFDNSTSRSLVTHWCADTQTPCLHAGLGDDYGEVLWNAVYRVPSATQDDICDYPLARNLAILTATVACEAIVAFVADGTQRSYTLTLRDLSISSLK
jgi:molybdopterin/thiamine biosynthesis adenylyltransferase